MLFKLVLVDPRLLSFTLSISAFIFMELKTLATESDVFKKKLTCCSIYFITHFLIWFSLYFVRVVDYIVAGSLCRSSLSLFFLFFPPSDLFVVLDVKMFMTFDDYCNGYGGGWRL
jgi:hypothetical protein